MADLAATAVRVTADRRCADEWAVVLASSGIHHRLLQRVDGWALIVTADDAPAALEALDAYDRENAYAPGEIGAAGAPAAALPTRQAAVVGITVALLLMAFFSVTGSRAERSSWFQHGSAAAERIVAGEWWRTVTALTLHASATHVVGNAAASALLVGAVVQQLGPGVGLWLLLLAGAGGNALTAIVHGAHHDSVGASTATFAAIGVLAATRTLAGPRRPRARHPRWVIAAASLALLALLGTGPDADLLAHLFGLLVGAALGLAAALLPVRAVSAPAQWTLAAGALAVVAEAWRQVLS